MELKIDILSEKKNPLMKREELLVRIEHTGARTPNRQDITKSIAKKIKKDERNIIVDKILTLSGKAESNARVLAYSSAKDIPAYKLEKMKRRASKAKKAEPAAEAPKEAETESKEPAAEKEEKAEEASKKEDASEVNEEAPAEADEKPASE